MKYYLAHGGGVNSTALMLLLEKEGVDFESVFADTGTEFPETYQYLDYLASLGFKITRIIPNVSGCQTLEEYCLKYRVVPSVWRKWCVGKFKIRPLVRYYEKPCVEFIGFAANEKQRLFKKNTETEYLKRKLEVRFPLIEWGITREDCKNIIRKAGLKVPPKSACWLCPMMSRSKVRKLYLEHPDLYERRKHVEENVPRNYFLDPRGRRMSSLVAEKTERLERFLEAKP